MDSDSFCHLYIFQVFFLEYRGVRSGVESYIRRNRIIFETPCTCMFHIYMLCNIKEIMKNRKGCKKMYVLFDKTHIRSEVKWNNSLKTLT